MNETPGQVVACIGVFDGVHRGHRTLIDTARSIADEAGLPLVAITFFPILRRYCDLNPCPSR